MVMAVAAGVAVAALASFAAAAPQKTLQLYTSQPDQDAAALVKAFEEAYPDVAVSIFRSGTEEVISRFLLEAESGHRRADVLLVADAPTFEALKQRGLLEAYRSPEAARIPAAYYDPEGMYYGTKVMATVIVYHRTLGKPLRRWADLLQPSVRGKLVMPSPFYSGAAAYNVGVWSRTEGLGWPWLEALARQDVLMVQGNGAVLRSVASGERPYGTIVDFMAVRARLQGSPIEVVYPEEGVPVITEPIGIVKGTPNLEAARRFVDFVLSKQGQELAARLGYMPLRSDVTPPEGFPALERIRVMAVPPAELAAGREADKQRFSDVFGQ
ncbi:MAG: ABC transporter substrate-binding protein [Limnochordaceae bacterium]|nr:ABC transporter substrate-binding protein [Limnochordaceae bacterium]